MPQNAKIKFLKSRAENCQRNDQTKRCSIKTLDNAVTKKMLLLQRFKSTMNHAPKSIRKSFRKNDYYSVSTQRFNF